MIEWLFNTSVFKYTLLILLVAFIVFLIIKKSWAKIIAVVCFSLAIIISTIFCGINLNKYYSAKGGVFGVISSVFKKPGVTVEKNLSSVNFTFENLVFKQEFFDRPEYYSVHLNSDETFNLDMSIDYLVCLNGVPLEIEKFNSSLTATFKNVFFDSDNKSKLIDDLKINIYFYNSNTQIVISTSGGSQAYGYWLNYFQKEKFVLTIEEIDNSYKADEIDEQLKEISKNFGLFDENGILKKSFYDLVQNKYLSVDLISKSIGFTPKTVSLSGNLKVPDYFKNINDNTFVGCSDLISVSLSPMFQSFGYHAFYNCKSLVSVEVRPIELLEEENLISPYSGSMSDLYKTTREILTFSPLKWFENCPNLKKVSFGSNYLSFYTYDNFVNCPNLEYVFIPSKINVKAAFEDFTADVTRFVGEIRNIVGVSHGEPYKFFNGCDFAVIITDSSEMNFTKYFEDVNVLDFFNSNVILTNQNIDDFLNQNNLFRVNFYNENGSTLICSKFFSLDDEFNFKLGSHSSYMLHKNFIGWSIDSSENFSSEKSKIFNSLTIELVSYAEGRNINLYANSTDNAVISPY